MQVDEASMFALAFEVLPRHSIPSPRIMPHISVRVLLGKGG